jgi:hypothetical protein
MRVEQQTALSLFPKEACAHRNKGEEALASFRHHWPWPSLLQPEDEGQTNNY